MKGGGMANQLSQSLLEQKEKEREGDIIIKKIPLLVLKKKKKSNSSAMQFEGEIASELKEILALA